jgi:acetaldehyde dehydrogenase
MQTIAILGSGNIGTDLMVKVLRTAKLVRLGGLAGIDAQSDGLARARRMGVNTTAGGVDDLIRQPWFDDVSIVLDATSAKAHRYHDSVLRPLGRRIIDLTPASIGPYTVPVVNFEQHLDAPNMSMVSCGGQATIPIVAAVSRVARVHYAEIVASIASKSAGPGTRANIDEFTHTTARAIEIVGGAERGKAIIVLNPADPPLIMRDTVYCLSDTVSQDAIGQSVHRMIEAVQTYVPGYRLKQDVQFERARMGEVEGLKTTVFLEVEGAAHYLPAYAGNLDIMTSAALATAERVAQQKESAQ